MIQECSKGSFGTIEIGEERFSALFRVVSRALSLPLHVVMGGCKAVLFVIAILSCYVGLGIKLIHRGKINIDDPEETELKLHPTFVLPDIQLHALFFKPVTDSFLYL